MARIPDTELRLGEPLRATFEIGAPIPANISARWFHALYETPLVFSGILDAQGRVLDANLLSVEGCGLVRDEVIGRPFWECGWWNRDPELARQIRDWCSEAVASGAGR